MQLRAADWQDNDIMLKCEVEMGVKFNCREVML
jgi:hypothetical protein